MVPKGTQESYVSVAWPSPSFQDSSSFGQQLIYRSSYFSYAIVQSLSSLNADGFLPCIGLRTFSFQTRQCISLVPCRLQRFCLSILWVYPLTSDQDEPCLGSFTNRKIKTTTVLLARARSIHLRHFPFCATAFPLCHPDFRCHRGPTSASLSILL